jgi:hypothetical protein
MKDDHNKWYSHYQLLLFYESDQNQNNFILSDILYYRRLMS